VSGPLRANVPASYPVVRSPRCKSTLIPQGGPAIHIFASRWIAEHRPAKRRRPQEGYARLGPGVALASEERGLECDEAMFPPFSPRRTPCACEDAGDFP
jgi:hypothetical protein